MTTRQLTVSDESAPTATQDVTLRTPPNWTAVGFIAGLSGLHLFIAIPGFYNGRWESFLSLAFGIIFACASIACWLVRRDVTIEQRAQRIRVRVGYRRLSVQRFIPFHAVRGVRLMMMAGKSPSSTRIELLCENEDLECPPTDIPRQQALCLAMTMNVRLIKVYGDSADDDAPRLSRV